MNALHEPTPQDLAWARMYQRAPGKVAAARAYLLKIERGHWNPREANHAARRLNALTVAMAEKTRCRECGKALKTDKSKAAGIGPECADKLAKAAG